LSPIDMGAAGELQQYSWTGYKQTN
jgi:hypothetical protein